MASKNTTAKAILLLQNFEKIKEQYSIVQGNIQKEMDKTLSSSSIISSKEVESVTRYFVPVKELLNEYTSGLPSYLRAAGKMDETKKPSETFLNKVRDILEQAREIEDVFDWMEQQFIRQVSLHNMSLGDFSIFTSEPEAAPAAPVPEEKESFRLPITTE